MKNISMLLCFFLVFLSSCYEDLGNYDYHEINRIERVQGLDSVIRIVQFDTLRIRPIFEANGYSDPEQFSYEWEISAKIVSTEMNLEMWVNLPYGDKNCRFIITDKVQGNKFYFPFRLLITSERAGDAVVVLSNYKGKAELSFKSIAPDTSHFVANYYESVVGMSLGTHPRKLYRNYIPVEAYSGLLVQTAEGLKSIADTTLEDFGYNTYLDEQFFQRQIVYPKPSIPEFLPQGFWWGMLNWVLWGEALGGDFMTGTSVAVIIADGKLYSFNSRTESGGLCSAFLLGKASPYGGSLSPVFTPVVVTPAESDFFVASLAYEYSNYKLMFDETVGRFVCVSGMGTGFIEIPESDIPAFEGYRLIYATHTNRPNYCVAVLAKGEEAKALLLKLPANNDERVGTDKVAKVPFELVVQMDMPENIMNAASDFYQFKAREYNLVSAGGKLFSGNVFSWASGILPAEVFSLTSLGYDENARITCFDMSRTEKTLVLGVSRYGNDTEGSGNDLKGDVIYLDVADYQVKKDSKGRDMIYRGVSGYPVDILIKWQNWYRDGKNQNGKVMDAM